MNFANKKIFISPHTPKTTMLEKVLKETYDLDILGFIDKQKNGKDIYRLDDVVDVDFDMVLIYSPNHFASIYEEYKKKIIRKKLIQIDIKDQIYIFNDYKSIFINGIKEVYSLFKLNVFKKFISFIDLLNIKRDGIVFISKDFVGTNNKALFLEYSKLNQNTLIMTDYKEHLQELKRYKLKASFLGTIYSFFRLAKAKIIIQDQGNSNFLIKHLSCQQTKIQLWHGIPLKRMNQLVDVIYDYHISTSNFVNKTSLSKVIQAKNHLDLGYPRNDLLLKEHNDLDLLFVDKKIYYLAKENTIILYMPTHRESTPAINERKNKPLPLDLNKLNNFMKTINSYFIFKLHPFISKLHEDENYSNILFYDSKSDIYPVLKYTDILVTDYSSVYFDFLLLNRPIVFFDYDYEEYSSNMDGFVYDYNENTPGEKVKTQQELETSIAKSLRNNDSFIKQRENILNKYFMHTDHNSSQRIIKKLFSQEEIDE